jgi:hypothetical protein
LKVFYTCQGDKGWFGEVEDKYTNAVVHITKVERVQFKGMYRYFFPPRIGIDFYSPENYPNGSHDFIPNLELGDIARLIKILELVERDQTFNSLASGNIKPFKIGLAFETDLKRRIIVGAELDHLTIKYEGLHRGSEVSIEYWFTRKGIQKFVAILKELVIEYMDFIQRYVLIGKIDPKFK